jgi:hypothetical protein
MKTYRVEFVCRIPDGVSIDKPEEIVAAALDSFCKDTGISLNPTYLSSDLLAEDPD